MTVIASSLTVTRRPISLPLTLVAVSSLDRRIRFSPYVLRKRTASMVRLFELILFVSPHVSLVRASVDKLSLGSHDLLPKFLFQTQLLLQGINSLGSLSLSQVLIVCIRVTSFFAECFEIRSLGTSHGIITTHPFVRFLLIGCV